QRKNGSVPLILIAPLSRSRVSLMFMIFIGTHTFPSIRTGSLIDQAHCSLWANRDSTFIIGQQKRPKISTWNAKNAEFQRAKINAKNRGFLTFRYPSTGPLCVSVTVSTPMEPRGFEPLKLSTPSSKCLIYSEIHILK